MYRFDKSAGQLPELVQTLDVPSCDLLADGGMPGNCDSVVLVSNGDRIYRLMPTPFEKQISLLLRKSPPQIEDALQLLQDTTSPKEYPSALMRFHKTSCRSSFECHDFRRCIETLDTITIQTGGNHDVVSRNFTSTVLS